MAAGHNGRPLSPSRASSPSQKIQKIDDAEVIIVGQGIAGTCLAWALRGVGCSPLVIDRPDDPYTASRVAAGLITSVTGPRLSLSADWAKFREAAEQFYQQVECELKESIVDWQPAVRLIGSDGERSFWEKRRNAELAGTAVGRQEIVSKHAFHGDRFGIEMSTAGRLRVRSFLEASRQYFSSAGGFIGADLNLERDIEVTALDVRIPRLGVKAGAIVFCNGFAVHDVPLLRDLRTNPARGEILMVRVPELQELRPIHSSVWIAPERDGTYRVGATYDWKDLSSGPTEQGRADLCHRLSEVIRVNFEIVDHVSAVRPILHQLEPVIGCLPHSPRVGAFNGLGSKGALQAPLLATQLARHIAQGDTIDRRYSLAERLKRDLRS